MADREYKSLSFTNIKAQSSGRVRTGIAAVFGNIDEVGDRIQPGAFTRSINSGISRVKHLWNHSWQHPPIAKIVELREVTRAELPGEVLAKAPDATGGLLVKREYYGQEIPNWILEAIDAGDINEMSFAFDIIKSSISTEPIDDNPDNTREVRELIELKLYDTSDVLWGCNFATVAAGAKNFELLPVGVIASQLAMLAEQVKSGARNAASDQKLIELIHTTAVDLGAVCNPDESGDEPKSLEKPEPAEPSGITDNSTSLSPNWLELQKAKTRVLAMQINT